MAAGASGTSMVSRGLPKEKHEEFYFGRRSRWLCCGIPTGKRAFWVPIPKALIWAAGRLGTTTERKSTRVATKTVGKVACGPFGMQTVKRRRKELMIVIHE